MAYNVLAAFPPSAVAQDELTYHTVNAARSPHVDATGESDSTAGLRAIVESVPPGGARIFVAAGRYVLSAPLYLRSHTHIACAPGATFLPVSSDMVFANRNADVDWRTDVTPPIAENQTDIDIAIDGCTVDATQVVSLQANPRTHSTTAAFRFRLVRGLTITNNRIYGDTTGENLARIPNAISFVGVTDAIIARNKAQGVYNGFGAWGGSSFFTVSDNTWSIAPNAKGTINSYSCSNINGVGTSSHFHQTTHDFVYERNTCYTHGGRGPNPHGVVAYNNGSLSSGSKIVNGKFSDNVTVATGRNNICYVARGDIERFDLTNNVFKGCDTATVILSGGTESFGVVIDPLMTTAGSSRVSVSVPKVSEERVSIGNWVNLRAKSSVGGLVFDGNYRITSVGRDEFTIDARREAASSQIGGGPTTIVANWGSYRNSRITGNRFEDCNSFPGDGALVVLGPGNAVSDNFFEGGKYGSKVLASSYDCCSILPGAPDKIGANHGVVGYGVTRPTGGFPVEGTGDVSYQRGYAPR